MKKKIAVIGGGAAGLTAAISAARAGADVTVFERLDRAAKKILATGNGRCNLTNLGADISHYHGETVKFVSGALNRFWVQDTLNFFLEIGLVTKTEEGGKVYPYSLQASAVSDVLRMEAERLSVPVRCGFEVTDIVKNKNGFKLIFSNGKSFVCGSVILTAGGKASPNLGSNGSGYTLSKKMGHSITPLFPSLVQVKTDNTYTKALQGLKIIARACFCENNTVKKEAFGEVLFTDYGLSGPPIFDLSRLSSVSKNGEIVLDIMPEYTKDEVQKLLKDRISASKTLENYFTGLLPKKLGQILLKSCGIAPLSQKSTVLSAKEISALTEKIKGWHFKVLGTMSWNNAQVTAGGVRTSEVNPATMESKLVKNLFLAGEVLDIDGDCGGYNLQWAWSSGYLAGLNAAKQSREDV